MSIKRVGVVGSGIMGSGSPRWPPRPEAVVLRTARRPRPTRVAGLEKSLAEQVDGASSTGPTATRRWLGCAPSRDLGELADCDLVIESIVEDLEARRSSSASSTASVTPARSSPPTRRRCRGRDGDGDRAARAGLRHPLLQPRADDAAGRDRAAASPRATRPSPRPMAFADDLRQEPGRGARTAPGSSSTRCSSRTSTTRCACSSTATATTRTSTPR